MSKGSIGWCLRKIVNEVHASDILSTGVNTEVVI